VPQNGTAPLPVGSSALSHKKRSHYLAGLAFTRAVKDFPKLIIEFLALNIGQMIAARTILRADSCPNRRFFSLRLLSFHEQTITAV
jgi:hypothetical protein